MRKRKREVWSAKKRAEKLRPAHPSSPGAEGCRTRTKKHYPTRDAAQILVSRNPALVETYRCPCGAGWCTTSKPTRNPR